MSWCEQNNVDYVFGMAKNKRLLRIIGRQLHEAKLDYEETGQASRRFHGFMYQTRKSWQQSRRVVAKAEHLSKGSNPRFIVTSLKEQAYADKLLYEKVYCARGEMENRIKSCLLMLTTGCVAGRLSPTQARRVACEYPVAWHSAQVKIPP